MIRVDTTCPNIELELLAVSGSTRVLIDSKKSELLIDKGISVGVLQDDRVFRRIENASDEAGLKLRTLYQKIESGDKQVNSDDSIILSYIDDLNMSSIIKPCNNIQFMAITSNVDDIVYGSVIRQLNDKKVLTLLDRAIVRENNKIAVLSYNARIKSGLPIIITRCGTILRELESIENGNDTLLTIGKRPDIDYNQVFLSCITAICIHIEKNITGISLKEMPLKQRFIRNLELSKYKIALCACKCIEMYLDGECISQIGDRLILRVGGAVKREDMEANIRFLGCETTSTIKIKVT